MQQFITDDASTAMQDVTGIKSIQNGLLLAVHPHLLWDDHLLAINVNDDNRVISFHPSGFYDGGTLYTDPNTPEMYQPSPALLRYQFRQCVLANMKGAGARDDFWDHEDTHDLSQDVWQQTSGGMSRIELELRTRIMGEVGV